MLRAAFPALASLPAKSGTFPLLEHLQADPRGLFRCLLVRSRRRPHSPAASRPQRKSAHRGHVRNLRARADLRYRQRGGHCCRRSFPLSVSRARRPNLEHLADRGKNNRFSALCGRSRGRSRAPVSAPARHGPVGAALASRSCNALLESEVCPHCLGFRPRCADPSHLGPTSAGSSILHCPLVSRPARVSLGVAQLWRSAPRDKPERCHGGPGVYPGWLCGAGARSRWRLAGRFHHCVYRDLWSRKRPGRSSRNPLMAYFVPSVQSGRRSPPDSRGLVAGPVARDRQARRPNAGSRDGREPRRHQNPAGRGRRVKCPFCAHVYDKVIDSREGRSADTIRRRRECLKCGRRFTTYDRIDEIPYMVIKKDGRRERFERQNILQGLLKACEKRPVPTPKLEAISDEIEGVVQESTERELTTTEIGEMIMHRLKKLDKVAYVRFASVYMDFKDVQEFMSELKNLLKDRVKK